MLLEPGMFGFLYRNYVPTNVRSVLLGAPVSLCGLGGPDRFRNPSKNVGDVVHYPFKELGTRLRPFGSHIDDFRACVFGGGRPDKYFSH